MKLGKDFWFWIRLIAEILRAILGLEDSQDQNPSTPGLRAFNAVLASLVSENEDDSHTAADLIALREPSHGTS